MLHQLLKLKTKPAHNALEKELTGKIQKVRTVENYDPLLKLFYGYYASIEKEKDRFVTGNDVGFYNSRRKFHFLYNNIAGRTPTDHLLLCPSTHSYSSAVGASYAAALLNMYSTDHQADSIGKNDPHLKSVQGSICLPAIMGIIFGFKYLYLVQVPGSGLQREGLSYIIIAVYFSLLVLAPTYFLKGVYS